MPALEPLCSLINIQASKLSKNENFILEAELFFQLYRVISKLYTEPFTIYLKLLPVKDNKEIAMLEENFMKCLVQDILNTQLYTLEGIAYYTGTPEDTIYDIAAGNNTNPSLSVSRKIFELHRSIRPDLYASILAKALEEN